MSGDANWANVSLLLPMSGANNSTTFTDVSSVGNTVTAQGAAKVTTAVTDPFGGTVGVLTLTGNNADYLSLPGSANFNLGTGDWTVQFWVQWNVANDQEIVWGGDTNSDLNIWTNPNAQANKFGLGKQLVAWTSAFAWTRSTGVWYYVQIGKQSGTARLYIDGSQVGTGVADSTAYGVNGGNLYIGHTTETAKPLNAYMSNFRLTKGVWRTDTSVPTAPFEIGPLVNPPVADFTGTPTSGTAPLTVAFTDASTNTPTSWAWTFGDSGTSTSQNPSHQYASAGTYTVALTATNAGGNNTKTRTGYITVAAPVAGDTHDGGGFLLFEHGRKRRKKADESVRKELEELLADPPAEVAPIVAPHIIEAPAAASAAPQPKRVDWASLRKDAEAVAQLLELYRRLQTDAEAAAIDQDDEDVLLLI